MPIRRALESDDEILIRHYRAIWESYGVAAENIKADAEQIVRDFIDDGRSRFKMAAFLAELGGEVVGSAACQLHRVPYPAVTVPSFRQHGYIWHVFVEPAVRRQGVAAALVRRSIEYLTSIGCTTAVLHSSDAGKALYERLGFQVGPEMRLDLTGQKGPRG